jgi:Trk-type K+ transport system membrane component
MARMEKSEFVLWWFLSLFSGVTVVAAKIGYLLFRLDVTPPEGIEPAKHWRRKRVWLTISEFMALPCFATASLTATIIWELPILATILISMVLGGLGFSFLLEALQWTFKRRLGMETPK